MRRVLFDCFDAGARGYSRDLLDYVSPWADWVATVEQPVTIWHGAADNWAPPAMADALAAILPNVVRVNRLLGYSHYSTLQVALQELLSHASPINP